MVLGLCCLTENENEPMISTMKTNGLAVGTAGTHHTCSLTHISSPALQSSRKRRHRRPAISVHGRCRVVLSVAVLLLVGVETNHGPARSKVVVGTLNARSAVLHVAELHDLIEIESIDLLAVCESRVRSTAPDTVSNDLASTGYKVVNTPRMKDRSGGGLAVIHQDYYSVSSFSLKVKPTVFEFMAVKFTTGTDQIILVKIYRQPKSKPTAVFYDELSDHLMYCEMLVVMLSSLVISTVHLTKSIKHSKHCCRVTVYL
jgi:hypothetical protein